MLIICTTCKNQGVTDPTLATEIKKRKNGEVKIEKIKVLV